MYALYACRYVNWPYVYNRCASVILCI